MRVEISDLEHAFVGRGTEFQRLVHDLVRREARGCGIPQDQIDYDDRVNVRDGGRDIVIRVPSRNSNRNWIPVQPSIWSAKSGADAGPALTLGNLGNLG